ncbi:MAG: chemotaxis protein CheB [Gemmatimonadaceae bacterium]
MPKKNGSSRRGPRSQRKAGTSAPPAKHSAQNRGRLATTGTRKTKSSKLAEPLCVVGIGASAGGLEAFRELLAHLPVDTGMAIVLVQHLDPTHASLLAELLARSATIPVHEARNGTTLAANCAYVIPPNKSMTVADGALALAPPLKGKIAPSHR